MNDYDSGITFVSRLGLKVRVQKVNNERSSFANSATRLKSTSIGLAPTPWQLRGRGYLMFFRFSVDQQKRRSFLSRSQQARLEGGLSTVLLLDHQDSSVGSHQELLYIPGKLPCAGEQLSTFSKAYSSSQEAIDGARLHWGITKEAACFDFDADPTEFIHDDHSMVVAEKTTHFISVKKGSSNVLATGLRAYGPSFGLSSRFLPKSLLRMGQSLNNQSFVFQPELQARARLVHVDSLFINPTLFPDVRLARLVGCLQLNNLNMTYPLAQIDTIEHLIPGIAHKHA